MMWCVPLLMSRNVASHDQSSSNWTRRQTGQNKLKSGKEDWRGENELRCEQTECHIRIGMQHMIGLLCSSSDKSWAWRPFINANFTVAGSHLVATCHPPLVVVPSVLTLSIVSASPSLNSTVSCSTLSAVAYFFLISCTTVTEAVFLLEIWFGRGRMGKCWCVCGWRDLINCLSVWGKFQCVW